MAWDYTKKKFNNQASHDVRWKLERAINYGDGERKLNRSLVKEYLPQLRIPKNRRLFLAFLLWHKTS